MSEALQNVNQKNNTLMQKESIQMGLMAEIENKEKLLLTRSRMLQISHDRNAYKKQVIYTLIASALAIFILAIFGYNIIRKTKI